jgi:hypothetical protein
MEMSTNTYFAHALRPGSVFCSRDHAERARLKRRGWMKVSYPDVVRLYAPNKHALMAANELCGGGEYSWVSGRLQCMGNGASRLKPNILLKGKS